MPAAAPAGSRRTRIAFLAVAAVLALGAAGAWPAAVRVDGGASRATATLSRREVAFLDTLESRTFRWFWELSDPRTGLTPDRAPTRSFASISATGFALTAYPIGAERGWITRRQAGERVLRTLEFLAHARQDTLASGSIGTHGFFYHFLDPGRGTRFQRAELPAMDTALLLAGLPLCRSHLECRHPPQLPPRAPP